MKPTFTHKRPVESFIVVKNTAMFVTEGTNINNGAGNVILADGQIGLVSMSHGQPGTVAPNTIVNATATVAKAPEIAIFQGTPASANVAGSTSTYPLEVQPYERTHVINGKSPILVRKQAYRDPKFSTWVFGATAAASAGKITALDNTRYELTIAYRGRVIEQDFSVQQSANARIAFTTPNFTALGLNAVQARDFLVKQLGYKAALQSAVLRPSNLQKGKDPFVVFALSATTGQGGQVIATIGAGVAINVVVSNGTTKTFTPTATQLATIKAAAIAGGHTHIVPIDLSNAGAGVVDGLMFMAIDRPLVVDDRIGEVKIGLRIAGTAGFEATVYQKQVVTPDEGQGLGRVLAMQFAATQGQRKYFYNSDLAPIVKYPNPFDVNATYTTYTIHHGSTENIDTNTTIYSPKKEIICIPSGSTFDALRTAFEGALNSYLASGNNTPIIEEV